MWLETACIGQIHVPSTEHISCYIKECAAVQNGAQRCRMVHSSAERCRCCVSEVCVTVSVGVERRCYSDTVLTWSRLRQSHYAWQLQQVSQQMQLVAVCYQSVCPLVRHSAPVGEWSIAISLCVCVCVSVGPRAYLLNCSTDLHEIFYADPLWPWLGPPLAALRYRGRVWYLVVSVITTPLSVSEKIQVGLSTDETSVY